MTVLEKLSWEYVNPFSHPGAYFGDNAAIRREDVPEHWWQPVETQPREDVSDQHRGLLELVAAGELIRNVRRYRADVVVPDWQETA